MNIRSLHFVPANNKKFIMNINNLNPDIIIFDLEDSVPDSQKASARSNVLTYAERNNARKIFIRINNIHSKDYREDIKVVSKSECSGLILPKIETPEMVEKLLNEIKLNSRNFTLIVLIESFSGLENLSAIASIPEIGALGLGLEDLLSELVLLNDETEKLAEHIRLQMILKCKAFNKFAIDTISNEYRNHDLFRAECIKSRQIGFDGKFSIHPSQIDIINEVFRIDDKTREWAESILKEADGQSGVGYTKTGTQLITPPKVMKARKILNAVKS